MRLWLFDWWGGLVTILVRAKSKSDAERMVRKFYGCDSDPARLDISYAKVSELTVAGKPNIIICRDRRP